jgi:hypothetical protein
MLHVNRRQQFEAYFSLLQHCDSLTGGGAFDEVFPRFGNVMYTWERYVGRRSADMGSRLVWERE